MIWLLLVILLIFLIVGISRGNKKKKLEIEEMENKVSRAPAQKNGISIADELQKIKDLRDGGVLTDAEFEDQKKKILNQ